VSQNRCFVRRRSRPSSERPLVSVRRASGPGSLEAAQRELLAGPSVHHRVQHDVEPGRLAHGEVRHRARRAPLPPGAVSVVQLLVPRRGAERRRSKSAERRDSAVVHDAARRAATSPATSLRPQRTAAHARHQLAGALQVHRLIRGSLSPHESAPKRHLDRFSRLRGAHERDQQTDRHTDRSRYSVCSSNSPHSMQCMRCNLIIIIIILALLRLRYDG